MVKRLWSAVRSIRIPMPPLRPLAAWLRERRGPIATWGMRAAAVGSLALIVLVIHRSVYSFVVRQRDFHVRSASASVDVAPGWADPRTGDGVVNLRVTKEEWNLFDEGLVARIGKAFEQNAWVRTVTSVERVFPDQVRVKFDLRKPHMAVKRPNGYCIVDRDGVRLPGVYVEPPACSSPVVASGVAAPPPVPGQKWAGADVAAALEMAELLSREPVFARAKITGVDLSNLEGRLDRRRAEIALVTSNGCTVEWGRTPSSRRHGEVPLAEKLDNLRLVLETWPNLEGRQVVKLHVAPRGQFPPTVPREPELGSQKRK